MKKLLTLFFALFLWAFSSWGQTVVIGTGTVNSYYYGPVYRSSAASTFDWSRHNYLFTATELAAAGITSGATITQLGWYKTNAFATTGNASFNIYMKNTALTTLVTGTSWTSITTGATLVYNSVTQTLPASTGWIPFALSTPFTYTGGSIEIAVDWDCSMIAGNPSTGAFNWQYTSGLAFNGTIGAASGTAAPTTLNTTTYGGTNRPNIQITYVPGTSPYLTAAPGVLNCGYAAFGGSAVEQMYVLGGNNLTAGPIVVTAPSPEFTLSLTSGGPYTSSVNVGYTPPALGPTNIYVLFTPSAANADYSGNITNVGGGASLNVAVSGTSWLYKWYCTSSANSALDEDIGNVTISTLNNSSTCTTTGDVGSILNRYSNYTVSVPPFNLQQSSTNPFSVSILTCGTGNYNNAVKIFIDFNQDGDFIDTGEQVYVSPTYTLGAHVENGTIAVPAGATLGTTMMRVVNVETTTPATIAPCGTYGYGETEDYLVTIIPMSTTTLSWYNLQWPPTGSISTTQNITVYAQCWESGVTEAAGPGTGITCWIGYSTTNTDPSTWTNWVPAAYNFGFDPNNNDEYMADLGAAQGLLPGTYYYASRFQYLGGPLTYGGYNPGGGGAWDGVNNVSGVLTVNPNLYTIPHTQNFDAALAWPTDWSTNNANVWSISTSWPGTLPPTGNHVYSDYTPYETGTVYSPHFDATGSSFVMVSFYHYWRANYNVQTQDGYFYGSPDGGTTVYLIDEWHHNNPAIEEGTQQYIISTWAANASNLVFWWQVSHNDDWYWVWDDFVVTNVAPAGYWSGAVDTDWFNTGNWLDGTVPTATTDVTIPGGCPNYPVIYSATSCNSMNILNGATFTIPDSFFDVFLSITNTGTLNISGGTTTVAGDLYVPTGGVVNMSNGIFNVANIFGAGSFTWSPGTFTFSGGTINQSGTCFFNAGTGSSMSGSFVYNVGGTVQLPTAMWTMTGGTFNLFGTSAVTNYFLPPTGTGTTKAYNVNVNSVNPYIFARDTYTSFFDVLNDFSIQQGLVNLESAAATGRVGTFTVGGDVNVAANNTASFSIPTLSTVNVAGDFNQGLVAGSGYGSVIGAANISGAYNFSVNFPGLAAGRWELISPPVSNATAGMFLCQYLMRHDPATNLWIDIVEPTTPLDPGYDYALWIHPDAIINNASQVCPVIDPLTGYVWTGSRNAWGAVTATLGDGWNNVGNPYSATIDWTNAGWTKTNVNDAIYFENNGTWSGYVAGVPYNGGSQYIAPTQGFFVQSEGGGSLGFATSTATHTRTTFYKSDISNLLRLVASGNGRTDETVIRILDVATAGFDPMYDAHKLFNNPVEYPQVPQFYSMDNGYMAVNALDGAEMVALGFRAGLPGVYTIGQTEANDFSHVVLEDLVTGTFTDLLQSDYTFQYNTGDNEGRFIVHFTPLGVGDNLADAVSIYAYGHMAYVNVPENAKGDIRVINMMGQEVASSPLNNVLNSVSVPASGSYIVKVTTNEKVYTQKINIQ